MAQKTSQAPTPDLKEMFCVAESYQVAARTLGELTMNPGGKVYAAPHTV
jgi:hypothetical protein